jgi:glycosyltransferase involved in cell wall biosynthesis
MRRLTGRPAYLLLLTWPISQTGGVNEVVLALAGKLRDYGYYPIIAVATWDGAPAQPAEYRGIEVITVRLREPILPGLLKTVLADSAAFLRLVRERNVAAVNFHFPSLDVWAPAVLKMLGLLKVPLVLSFHGADVPPLQSSTGMNKRLWRFVLKRATAVTACSHALSRELLAFSPRLGVTVVQNGVDADLFRTRSRLPHTGPPSILHIGKFEHKKAQDVLLKAFRQLCELGIDAKLVLVGAAGPQLNGTRELIAALNLESKVEVHVNVPHERIPSLMQGADLFVLPSRVEPFGIVLLEAGAAGLPVIASRVGGVPELLEDGRTGLLIAPDDEDALFAALHKLLTDKEYAAQLAAAWHSQVLTNWSWEQTTRGYLQTAGLKTLQRL